MSPRIIDPERRRQEIIEAYLELVADRGVGAVTTRALADHLGVANGALWRYFTNMDELLEVSFASLVDATNLRIAGHSLRASPLTRLVRMYEELLPLTPVTQLEATIVVSFWGAAAAAPERYPHTGDPVQGWRVESVRLIHEAVSAGELPASTNVSVMGDVLINYTLAAQITWVQRLVDSSDQVRESFFALLSFFGASASLREAASRESPLVARA